VILRTRVVPAALAVALAATLGGGTGSQAQPARSGGQGAAGIGDPYFPRDGNGGIDVLHYDVRDGYAFGTGRLKGRTGLDVRATQDLSRFNLDFLLPVRSVRVDGRRAEFRQVGDHELQITPSAPVAAGAQFRVSVAYAGYPARKQTGGESNWLADESEVVAMNEPHIATWWFPANDHPRDKASFDIRISVPRGNQVIANGVLVDRKRHGTHRVYHWRAVEPMAPYLAFFAAGSFDTRSVTCNGIPNYVAVSKERPDVSQARGLAAKGLADQTCAVLTAYSSVLGPYPFSATGGVVTSLPVAFALENQTRPTYPGLSGATPALVAHEVAHQWFGDSVSVTGWRDIWLNEGFAQFLQTYYLTEVLSGRSMQNWLTESYAGTANDEEFWRLSIDDPRPQHLFDGAVYARGSMAVQALRHRLGDTAFWTLLRTWVEQRRYGNGSVADFTALAAAVSGQDLTAFFDAWLRAPKPPAKTVDNGLV
jgi:aminopeptidase N